MKTPKIPQFNATAAAETQKNYNTQTAEQQEAYNKAAAAATQEYAIKAAEQQQAINTMNQKTAVGNLTYTTSVDPITGKLKYEARSELSPEQQAIFNTLQKNKQNIGNTASSTISNTFGQYGEDPNLIGGANSLTEQALNSMDPAWERFMNPEREQQRTALINQGLQEGSPAYQQQMDKLTQQQLLTKGSWLQNFMPTAFNMTKENYQLPLENVAKMLTMSNPEELKKYLINTPTANVSGATEASPNVSNVNYSELAKAQYEGQLKAYEAEIAKQNAILGAGVGAAGAVFGAPVGGGKTFGGQALANMFLK